MERERLAWTLAPVYLSRIIPASEFGVCKSFKSPAFTYSRLCGLAGRFDA